MPNTIIAEQTSDQIAENIQITNIWTAELESQVSVSDGSFSDIDDLSKTIKVGKGEALYITYDVLFTTAVATTGEYYGEARLTLDGDPIEGSESRFFTESSASLVKDCPVSATIIIDDLDADEYEVTLQAWAWTVGPNEAMESGSRIVIMTYK